MTPSLVKDERFCFRRKPLSPYTHDWFWPLSVIRVVALQGFVPPTNGLQSDAPQAARA
jgi:hypothetical protein